MGWRRERDPEEQKDCLVLQHFPRIVLFPDPPSLSSNSSIKSSSLFST